MAKLENNFLWQKENIAIDWGSIAGDITNQVDLISYIGAQPKLSGWTYNIKFIANNDVFDTILSPNITYNVVVVSVNGYIVSGGSGEALYWVKPSDLQFIYDMQKEQHTMKFNLQNFNSGVICVQYMKKDIPV